MRTSELLRAPGARSMVLTSLVARLPIGMSGLSELLLIRGAGWSYAQAGGVIAAYTVASSASAPALGRLVDRLGMRRVLLPLAVLSPAFTLVLLFLTRGGVAPGYLALASAAAGATLAPISACARALWPAIVPDPGLRTAAFGLEATLQEVVFIVGPVLVAVLAGVGSPSLAVAAIAVLGFFGTLAFAATSGVRARTGSGHAPGGGMLRALTPGVRTVLFAGVGMGISFGCFEVAMPAFAEHHATRAAGGFALAAFSGGSFVGGLIAASLPAARRADLRLLCTLSLLAVGLALPLLATSMPVIVVLALVAGIPIAPSFAASYGLVDALAPPHAATEAFAWISTSVVAGVSGGTALAGVLVSHAGLRAPLVLAVGSVGVCAAMVGLRRRSLVVS